MTLKPLTKEDAEQVRLWRNEVPFALRTPYPLTMEMQEDWYNSEICNRNSKTRIFGIHDGGLFIGYGGIENISWENHTGEISLLLSPEYKGKGKGNATAHQLYRYAFDTLNLNMVYGECYYCNSAVFFWEKLMVEMKGYTCRMPNRKFYNGKYHDSLYFSVTR